MAATHCDYASEEHTNEGPTGRFREVIEAVVTDYGGNLVAGPGPVGKVANRKYSCPVRITPTVLGGEVVSADIKIGGHVRGE